MNTSTERRAAARQRSQHKREVIQKELVRAKDPVSTGGKGQDVSINDRLDRIQSLLSKGLANT